MSELNRFYIETAIPDAPRHTGFVPNLLDPETAQTQAFRTFQVHADSTPVNYASTFAQQATIRIHSATPLNNAFFSEANIRHLQDEIRYGVWIASGNQYIIDPQNEDDLKTVMRSYYLQYSINDPDKLREELAALNKRVILFEKDR